MKRIVFILVFGFLITAAFAQQVDKFALTDAEQKEVLDLQAQIDSLNSQIEKVRLLQENKILWAANRRSLSIEKYELKAVGQQLKFTERPPVASNQVAKP